MTKLLTTLAYIDKYHLQTLIQIFIFCSHGFLAVSYQLLGLNLNVFILTIVGSCPSYISGLVQYSIYHMNIHLYSYYTDYSLLHHIR